MNVLPRILYVLQAIPIKLPPIFFNAYKRLCSDYIWNGKRPRIGFSKLTLPKEHGGLGLPDISRYHTACHLTRIVNWNNGTLYKDWVSLETAFSPIPLAGMPWLIDKHIPPDLQSHPLIGPSISRFHSACKSNNISSSPGPLTQLRMNPDFPPSMHPLYLVDHWSDNPVQAHFFFKSGSMVSADELASLMQKPPVPQWAFLLLSHYLKNLNRQGTCSRPLSPFELLATSSTPTKGLISTIYSLLSNNPTSTHDKPRKQWEKDLGISLTHSDWSKILHTIHKGSTNVSTQENGYKIQSRWYRTPSILHRFYPTLPNICWRCHLSPGTPFHIWWSCSLISPFWTAVHKLTKQVSNLDLALSPALCLLHHTTLPHKVYHKSLAMHMINAAKLCIPRHWRSTTPPNIKEWLLTIDKIAEMEELIHISNDDLHKYHTTWDDWHSFKLSTEYARLNS